MVSRNEKISKKCNRDYRSQQISSDWRLKTLINYTFESRNQLSAAPWISKQFAGNPADRQAQRHSKRYPRSPTDVVTPVKGWKRAIPRIQVLSRFYNCFGFKAWPQWSHDKTELVANDMCLAVWSVLRQQRQTSSQDKWCHHHNTKWKRWSP